MRAIAQPRARVAVKACHGSGKTFTAAEIVLWWTYTGGITLTTSASFRQVKRQLWAEIQTAHAGSKFPLGGHVNETEINISPSCYALGLSTDEGVNFQGFHGRILIVLDEAPGIGSDIFDAIRGARSGGDVRLLSLGNPIISSGPFYDAFTSQRSAWQTFTVGAFDTPNLRGYSITDVLAMTPEQLDANERDYLPTRHWVKEMYEELGPDSPLYASRVLGAFPLQSEDSLISLVWLESAKTRDVAPGGTFVAGLDVAGPGEDNTVLCVRQDSTIVYMESWAQPDPRGAVLAALAPWKNRIRVNVDSIGIGYYMAQHIRDAGFTVEEVNVGLPAEDTEKYANLKAEYYWGLRLRFQQGSIAGLLDEKTISQLSGIRYKHNARGQVVIESKDDARKRGVKSPDNAEAVMLAFANNPRGGIWFA